MRWYRCSGFWTLVLALVHLATTAVFYDESVESLLVGGPVGILDADPDLAVLRGAAFWYVMAGVFQLGVALIVWRMERQTGRAPTGYGPLLVVFGAVGCLFTPRSGFWLFLAIGALAIVNARRLGGIATASRPASPRGWR